MKRSPIIAASRIGITLKPSMPPQGFSWLDLDNNHVRAEASSARCDASATPPVADDNDGFFRQTRNWLHS